MEENEEVKKFKGTDIITLARPDLGVKGFQDITAKIIVIKSLFDELLIICESNPDIPKGLTDQLVIHIKVFNSYCQHIINYNIDTDGANNFNQRQKIINSINGWHHQLFSGLSANNTYNNFLTVYNAIRNFNINNLQFEQQEINDLKKDLESKKREVIDILAELRQKASQEVVTDYAVIFQQQAEKHSISNFSLNPFKISFGNAQWWLILSALFVVGFGVVVFILYRHFRIDFTNSNVSVITLQLITRLLILSFVIYLVTFSFKQYSVQKHLFTLNKHRQNTLNSYSLFLKTIDKDDPALRSTLMIEVAKAIYESGQTGYLNSKGGQDSPSIIEMTRFMNKP